MTTRTVAGINGDILTITEQGTRVFSKFKLFCAIKQLGYWDKIKAWLEENDLWDAFLLAQVVSEDNAQFSAGLKTIKELLGMSDEDIEKILSQCLADEYLYYQNMK